jgi:hypothetical protein
VFQERLAPRHSERIALIVPVTIHLSEHPCETHLPDHADEIASIMAGPFGDLQYIGNPALKGLLFNAALAGLKKGMKLGAQDPFLPEHGVALPYVNLLAVAHNILWRLKAFQTGHGSWAAVASKIADLEDAYAYASKQFDKHVAKTAWEPEPPVL